MRDELDDLTPREESAGSLEAGLFASEESFSLRRQPNTKDDEGSSGGTNEISDSGTDESEEKDVDEEDEDEDELVEVGEDEDEDEDDDDDDDDDEEEEE